MKEQIPGSFRAGDMWSFRSKASEDLNDVMWLLNRMTCCDTKKELLDCVRKAVSKLDSMKRRIAEKGTEYLLGDDDYE